MCNLDAYKQIVPKNKKIKCNMCNEYSLTYYNYKGTHIWICNGEHMANTDYTGCMNIQFEYESQKDLDNLVEFLGGINK